MQSLPVSLQKEINSSSSKSCYNKQLHMYFLMTELLYNSTSTPIKKKTLPEIREYKTRFICRHLHRE